MPFKNIKDSLGKFFGKNEEQEYVEIDLGQEAKKNKVLVRHFLLRTFEDVNDILNSLREGYTIAVIDIRPIKQKKDIIELKRAIAKIKKTVDAIEGDIKGFIDDIIIATPSFAKISKIEKVEKPKERDFL